MCERVRTDLREWARSGSGLLGEDGSRLLRAVVKFTQSSRLHVTSSHQSPTGIILSDAGLEGQDRALQAGPGYALGEVNTSFTASRQTNASAQLLFDSFGMTFFKVSGLNF